MVFDTRPETVPVETGLALFASGPLIHVRGWPKTVNNWLPGRSFSSLVMPGRCAGVAKEQTNELVMHTRISQLGWLQVFSVWQNPQ